MTATPTSPAPKRRHNPNLERDKVLDVALDLLNETGFEGLTLRRLAERLGVKAAALYWHFQNKQDLINHLAARIFAREFDASKADIAKASWQQILTGMGYGLCDALMRYRDGALLISNADLSQTNLGFKGREIVVGELLRKGFPPKLVYLALFSVVRYTLGYVIEEQSDPRAQKKGNAYISHAVPHLEAKYPEATEELIRLHNQLSSNPRYMFEQGLQLILDGVEKKLTA